MNRRITDHDWPTDPDDTDQRWRWRHTTAPGARWSYAGSLASTLKASRPKASAIEHRDHHGTWRHHHSTADLQLAGQQAFTI